jgi:subtilase family serine protease
MMRSLRLVLLGLAVTFTSALGHAVAGQELAPLKTQTTAEVQPTPRIVDRIDDSHLTILKGSHLAVARRTYDQGQVDAGLPMGDLFLILHRAPEVQRSFDQYVASEYDATSPNFHQWLTADQIGERFGPAAADVQNLAAWLRSEGFTVDEVAKDRVYLRFSGTAQQVQAAFHTEIHALEAKGVHHLTNMTDVSIPTALTPVVSGVRGLHNFYPRPLHRLGQSVTRDAETGAWKRTVAKPAEALVNPLLAPAARLKPLFGTTDTYGDVLEDIAPYDFATIYNVLPLWQKTTPIDGAGQTIAIAGTSNIHLADVAAFRTAFGLPTSAAANTPTVIVTNSDPGDCSSFADSCAGDLIENTLDVEWSGAVAKGASIVLVTSSAPTSTTDPLFLSENYIVQNKTASIMNVSYGECELVLGYAGNQQYNNLWQTAAAEGISVFVATGDSGSPACDQGYDAVEGVPYAAQFGLEVNGVASTPYDTAVGGTDFNWGSTAAPYWSTTNSSSTGANALGYIPEVAWNNTCTNPLILSTLAGDATFVGAAPVTDAESACNFVIYNYAAIESNYGVQLAGLVDTVGGGGGASNCTSSNGGYPNTCSVGYPKPTWQSGISGIPADGVRDIPDVSFFASDGFLGSSYLICVSGGGNACSYSGSTEPSAQEVGGTSVASPAMAGIMALIDQKVGAAQGNPNPTLYTLAASQDYAGCSTESATASGGCLFNDVDTGTIAMVCPNGSLNCTSLVSTDPTGVLDGYAAGAGYDLATGLGSLNVTNVVNKWPLSNAALVTLSPTSLSFPSTVQGFASAAKTVTLTNSGKLALSITGFSIIGENASSFSQTNTCPASLAAAANCTITITFKPAATGSLSASLSVADNAYNSPQAVSLSGTATATAPAASFSAVSISFGSTAVGATNSASATLTNTGTATLTITSLNITGTNTTSFLQTNNCGTSLAAGTTCNVTITFKPLVSGSLTATLQAVDNASNSPQSIALSGTATGGSGPSAAFNATSISFGSTAVGSSNGTSVTLSNGGTAALALTGISITGSNATSFLQTNTCGSSVAAGSSCVVNLTFKPLVSGSLTATLQAVDDAGNSPQSIALSGTATGGASPTLTFSPVPVTFASTPVGTTATQLITVKNTGTAAVSFTATTTVTGANASSFAKTASTCPNPLPAGASCTNTISFTPTTSGTLTATVTYTDTAVGSPQTVALSGTGAAAGSTLSFSPGALSFASTVVGSTATEMITVKNIGTTAVSFTATTTVTGVNASSFAKTASTCPNPLPAGASCTNTISFTPTMAGSLTAVVTYTDTAAGSPQTVALSGTGAASGAALSFSPSAVSFAPTAVGSTATQTISVMNTGTTAVSFTATTTVTGVNASSFAKTASTCPNPLPAGASCTNTISFTPTMAGSLSAVVTYTDTAAGSPQTVALSGTGAASGPTLSFSPGVVTFASTPVGSTATQMITVKNTGTTAVSFTATTTVTGVNASSFAKTGSTCMNPLPAGASCTNTISFTPTTTGSLTAVVTYSDSAAGSPQTVSLSGTGVASGPTLSFNPSAVTFASTAVGSTAMQMITVKNIGTTAVSFTATTTVTGVNASSFAKTASTCPNPLPAGASCTNTISFTPTMAGSLTAVVTYTDTAAGSPQTVALSGTGAASGAALSFSPSAVSFAPTAVGSTATQTISVMNTGTTAVSFTATTTVTGVNASSFAKTGSTCTNPLPAGASCTNTISFTPTTTGALNATVTYTDTATGSPQTVALSGTGK